MGFYTAREKAGYSLADVARELGLESSTPGKWELGVHMPRVSTMLRLAELYGCTINDLLAPETMTRPVVNRAPRKRRGE